MDEEMRGVCIGSAGNTLIPALLAIRAKGYRLWLEYTRHPDPSGEGFSYHSHYQAANDRGYFNATNPVELLGLIAMWETRGDDWKFKRDTELNIDDELMDNAKTFDSDGNELPDE